MRLAVVWLGSLVAIVIAGASCRSEEKPGAKVAEFQAKTPVYYVSAGDPDQRVRLSASMAAKVIEIVGRKPRAWTPCGGPKAAPAGYFVVGKHSYAYYGFLYLEVSEDPMWGYTWDDPALAKFWKDLVGRGAALSRLKDFDP